jgi:hypothetical protein
MDDYRTLCLAPTPEVVAVFEAVEKWAAQMPDVAAFPVGVTETSTELNLAFGLSVPSGGKNRTATNLPRRATLQKAIQSRGGTGHLFPVPGIDRAELRVIGVRWRPVSCALLAVVIRVAVREMAIPKLTEVELNEAPPVGVVAKSRARHGARIESNASAAHRPFHRF